MGLLLLVGVASAAGSLCRLGLVDGEVIPVHGGEHVRSSGGYSSASQAQRERCARLGLVDGEVISVHGGEPGRSSGGYSSASQAQRERCAGSASSTAR